MATLLVRARPLALLLSLGLLATIWLPAASMPVSASAALAPGSIAPAALVLRSAAAPVLM